MPVYSDFKCKNVIKYLPVMLGTLLVSTRFFSETVAKKFRTDTSHWNKIRLRAKVIVLMREIRG